MASIHNSRDTAAPNPINKQVVIFFFGKDRGVKGGMEHYVRGAADLCVQTQVRSVIARSKPLPWCRRGRMPNLEPTSQRHVRSNPWRELIGLSKLLGPDMASTHNSRDTAAPNPINKQVVIFFFGKDRRGKGGNGTLRAWGGRPLRQ